jgi:hypothetical protein
MEEQITLEPDLDYEVDPVAYTDAHWRWIFNGEASPWFATRDLAIADALTAHPEAPFG